MPPSPSPVMDAERRAWSYWFIDGLPNLVAGVLCLLISSVYALASAGPRHVRSPLVITLVAVAFGIYGVVFFRLRQTLEWLKSRITYPRTGYTTPPYFVNWNAAPIELTMLNLSNVAEKEAFNMRRVREDAHRRGWFFVAIIAAAGMSSLLTGNPWICAATGIVAGLGICFAARRDQRISWVVVYGLPFAGAYMYIFPSRHIAGAASFLAGVGFLLALDGVMTLIRYLRSNPAARA